MISAAWLALASATPRLRTVGQSAKLTQPEITSSQRCRARFGKGSRKASAMPRPMKPASIERRAPTVSPSMLSTATRLATTVPPQKISVTSAAATATGGRPRFATAGVAPVDGTPVDGTPVKPRWFLRDTVRRSRQS